uniref:Uncharacterized protein n=1 Tax=Anopheles atroparvus TaxID=41427 RepID=A0A182J2H5_ANOAO
MATGVVAGVELMNVRACVRLSQSSDSAKATVKRGEDLPSQCRRAGYPDLPSCWSDHRIASVLVLVFVVVVVIVVVIVHQLLNKRSRSLGALVSTATWLRREESDEDRKNNGYYYNDNDCIVVVAGAVSSSAGPTEDSSAGPGPTRAEAPSLRCIRTAPTDVSV